MIITEAENFQTLCIPVAAAERDLSGCRLPNHQTLPSSSERCHSDLQTVTQKPINQSINQSNFIDLLGMKQIDSNANQKDQR